MTDISNINTDKKELYSYDEALSVLTSQGKFHISLGLDRIKQLLELFGNPQNNLKIIHVAGTNGKGSTCAMISSVLKAAGYNVGLYTSPHLINYTERIKINDREISGENFASLVFKVIELADLHEIQATEFEILTAVALIYFAEKKVDIAILETGLGGRLDATNVIENPVLTIITSLDIDHIERLGHSIEQIAFEKSGIIKKDVPVITLNYNNGLDVIKKVAEEKASPLFLADYSKYKVHDNYITADKEYEMSLLGLWQTENLSLVLKTVEFLRNNDFIIPDDAVKSGIKEVCWPGRMQYIKEKNIILDGAHNLSGARALKSSLDFYFPDKKFIWIYSSLNTKDYVSIIKTLFGYQDIIICTKSSCKNAVDPEIIKDCIAANSLSEDIYITANVNEALDLSCQLMNKSNVTNDYIAVIAGSLYTVGESLEILTNNYQL